MEAFVVFDDSDIWWMKIALRKGYRHCSVVFRHNGRWMSYNPLSNKTHIEDVHGWSEEYDLPEALSTQGRVVVRSDIEIPERMGPIEIFSCVSSVKRFLGIQDRWIITPYQLANHLRRKNNAKIFKS